tara:strand:+ start:266 stop:1423 length:1158 start_codon:yes stop_codon:yes gene_type:complete
MLIRVRSPSDYNTYTNIQIDGNDDRTFTVYPTRHRRNDRGEDPTYKAIRNVIVSTVGKAAKTEGSLITVKGYGIAVRKVGNRYTVNGFRCNYNDIMTVVTRVLMRSVYVDADDEGWKALDEYLTRCVKMPMELSYVLENRVPYKYFNDKGELSECRLNVAQVGPEDFALELNDAFWYDITLRELKQFVNSYLKDDRRGKFYAISPEELVYTLGGNRASEAQIAVIKAFMSQNRQAENVEKRAMELLDQMAKNYKQVKTIKFKASKDQEAQLALAIQGKLTDWIIADNGMKRGVQDVSTYMLQKGAGNNSLVKLNKLNVDDEVGLIGPICIDNMMSGAAKGDQYAARAMAVMNDNVLGSYVSTVRSYLDRITKDSDLAGRFDWDAL